MNEDPTRKIVAILGDWGHSFQQFYQLALAAIEATGRLQTGHYCLQVAARRNAIVPGG